MLRRLVVTHAPSKETSPRTHLTVLTAMVTGQGPARGVITRAVHAPIAGARTTPAEEKVTPPPRARTGKNLGLH
jgi:hypothetical protein